MWAKEKKMNYNLKLYRLWQNFNKFFGVINDKIVKIDWNIKRDILLFIKIDDENVIYVVRF